MASLYVATPHCSLSKSVLQRKHKPKWNQHLIALSRPIISAEPISPIRIESSKRLPLSLSSLDSIKPYVQHQWKPILSGWLCSAVSVCSLSLMVPKIGKFSTVMGAVDVIRLREEAVALGALAMVRVLASYWQQAFLWDAALRAVYEMRVYVFQRVLQRDLGFFEGGVNGAMAGDIAYRITAEASDVADTVYALLNMIVPSILQLTAMATQMLVISPGLSLICALLIPLMAFVNAYLGNKLRKVSKKAHLSIASLSSYLNEVLPSILFLKANNAEFSEGARFRQLAHADLSACLRKKKMKTLAPQIVQMIYFGALLLFCLVSLVVFGGSFDCCGVVSFITSLVFLIDPIQVIILVLCSYDRYRVDIKWKIGNYVVIKNLASSDCLQRNSKMQNSKHSRRFLAILSPGAGVQSYSLESCLSHYVLRKQVQPKLENLDAGIGKAYHELKQGEPAVERLFDLTNFESKVSEKPNAVNIDSVKGDVRFCDISFKYGDDMTLVLNGLDLHVEAGETVALIGPSGGGKTTLIKLLLRLYDPLHGYILLDNHDIQSIRVENLRSHVGLVSQDVTLFSGTVAENIGYRDLMSIIDMEKVKVAARIANAEEFIQTLPEKYETNIGPKGAILSGGQKQRLAIARAVYQNASILILDEATSALDSRSELLVREALLRVMQNHTVIVIAHRLETVLMANRILLLENGKLQEVEHSSLFDGRRDSLASSGLVV